MAHSGRQAVARRRHSWLVCAIWGVCALVLVSAAQGCGLLIGTKCSGGHYDSAGSPEPCTDSNHYITCEGGEGQDRDEVRACPSDAPVCVDSTQQMAHECKSQDQIDCVTRVSQFTVSDLRSTHLDADPLSDLVFVADGTLEEAIGAPGGFLITTKIAEFTSEFRLARLSDDTTVDLVAMDRTGLVSILLGRADGTFAPAKRVLNGALHLLGSGDLDGDGIDDIVIESDPGRYAVLSSAQGFVPSEIALDPRTPPPTRAIVVKAGSSGAEIVFADALSDADVYARNGSSWALQRSLSGQLVTGADFNGDGLTDLLINSSGVANVYLGQANGSLQLGASIPGSAWLAADLNDDGKVDIEVQRESGLVALRGRGDGAFDEGPALHVFPPYYSSLVLIGTARGNELLIDYGPMDQVNASCVAR